MRRPSTLPAAARSSEKPCVASNTALVLHAQAGELVDVEEAAVVDLVGGDAPEREPVGLRSMQRVQLVLVGGRVDDRERRADRGGHRRLLDGERGQALLEQRPGRAARSAASAESAPTRVGGQVRERRRQAAQPSAPSGASSSRWPAPSRIAGIAARIEREAVLVSRRSAKLPASPSQASASSSALEHVAVLLAEHRQQHLAVELAVDRMPVDVEVARHTATPCRSRARRSTRRCRRRRPCGWARCRAAGPCRARAAPR